MSTGLWLPAVAIAQDQICTYAVEDWVNDVGEIETALQAADFKEAQILIEVMDREWICLPAPVPPPVILRYAQLRAFKGFHSGDPDGAARWARAAQFMDAEARYPEWIDESHPVYTILEYEDPTEIEVLEGQYINHPKKGGVFRNGVWLTVADGPSEVPVFIQVYDKDQQRVTIYWQEGAGFRAELLTEDAATAAKAKAPKWYVPYVAPPRADPAPEGATEGEGDDEGQVLAAEESSDDGAEAEAAPAPAGSAEVPAAAAAVPAAAAAAVVAEQAVEGTAEGAAVEEAPKKGKKGAEPAPVPEAAPAAEAAPAPEAAKDPAPAEKADAAEGKEEAAPAKEEAAPAKEEAAPAKEEAAPAKEEAAEGDADAAPEAKDPAGE